MRVITETHIHNGIDKTWLENLPASDEFKISIIDSKFEGLDHCVKTNSYNEIYWEKRGDRPNYSRMVRGVDPIKTNKVITVEVPHNGEVVLATAYFGNEIADKEPFEEGWSIEECEQWVKDNPNSFWATHALIEE